MTWMLTQIAPAPHLLDPKETAKSAESYARHWGTHELTRHIAEQKRAIEHEQAILAGYEAAYSKR